MKFNLLMYKPSIVAVFSLLFSAFVLFGMISSIPGFANSLKENESSQKADQFELKVSFSGADEALYKEAHAKLMPVFKEFTFKSDKSGLSVSSKSILDNGHVNKLIHEVKAIKPGFVWQLSKGCIGKMCPGEPISFILTAKKIKIS